jgi:N-acetylneuraminic acid mutarotase
MNNKIYVFGGNELVKNISSIECFDPKVEIWKDIGVHLPEAIEGLSTY